MVRAFHASQPLCSTHLGEHGSTYLKRRIEIKPTVLMWVNTSHVHYPSPPSIQNHIHYGGVTFIGSETNNSWETVSPGSMPF